MEPANVWTVHSDGSAVPNPGRMGLGAVLTAPDGTRHVLSVDTHRQGCNNEAEALAVGHALDEARQRGAVAVRVYCDNSVVVAQLAAPGTPPVVRLAAVFDALRARMGLFADCTVAWIPRHRNAEADALARAALGLVAISEPPPARKRRRKR